MKCVLLSDPHYHQTIWNHLLVVVCFSAFNTKDFLIGTLVSLAFTLLETGQSLSLTVTLIYQKPHSFKLASDFFRF